MTSKYVLYEGLIIRRVNVYSSTDDESAGDASETVQQQQQQQQVATTSTRQNARGRGPEVGRRAEVVQSTDTEDDTEDTDVDTPQNARRGMKRSRVESYPARLQRMTTGGTVRDTYRRYERLQRECKFQMTVKQCEVKRKMEELQTLRERYDMLKPKGHHLMQVLKESLNYECDCVNPRRKSLNCICSIPKSVTCTIDPCEYKKLDYSHLYICMCYVSRMIQICCENHKRINLYWEEIASLVWFGEKFKSVDEDVLHVWLYDKSLEIPLGNKAWLYYNADNCNRGIRDGEGVTVEMSRNVYKKFYALCHQFPEKVIEYGARRSSRVEASPFMPDAFLYEYDRENKV